jgi:gas vesicle protein
MRDETGSQILWFAAGVALGASLAVLFTPYSGTETRRLLGEKALEGRDVVAESGRDWVEKGRELFEQGKQLADEAASMYEDGRRMVEG